jgi:DNA-binding MltR family transcriptional regulator
VIVVVRPSLTQAEYALFDEYAKLFSGESDRGAVVLAASYLDSLLGDLFRAAMAEDASCDALLGGFGPLSAFSSRIEVAYAFGLLASEIRDDLNLIREIRNDFAHNVGTASFGTLGVRDRCAVLSSTKRTLEAVADPDNRFKEDGRLQFIVAVQQAMYYINKRKNTIARAIGAPLLYGP